jgi:hypothetical protein
MVVDVTIERDETWGDGAARGWATGTGVDGCQVLHLSTNYYTWSREPNYSRKVADNGKSSGSANGSDNFCLD